MIGKLEALSHRAIDAIGLGALLVVGLATYAIGIHPALDRRAAAERDAAALLTERAAAESAAAEVEAAMKLRDEIAAKQRSQILLEPASQVNARIGQLTSLASAERITIQQLAPGTPKIEPGKPYTAVPIRVQGAGTFADCIAFLQRLADQYRDISVPGIGLTISQPASENAPARLDMSLDLVWHAAPDDSAGKRTP